MVESWSGDLATDGTRIKHRYGKGAFYKEAKKAGSKEPNVGGGGKRQVWRRVCRATTGQRGRKTSELTRLMGTQPAQPGLTRFNPHDFFPSEAWNQPSGARNQCAELEMDRWSIGIMEKPICLATARSCGREKREIFHEFSRFFTFYHLQQARNYAIFTLSRMRLLFGVLAIFGQRCGLGLGGGAWEDASLTNRMASGCNSSLTQQRDKYENDD